LAIVFQQGLNRRLAWGADSHGRYHGKDYYEALDIDERAKFFASFKYLANNARFHNRTRFTKEIDDIYCLKAGQHRLACFFDGSTVVMIHGFRKKTDWDKRHKRELKKAVRLKEEYLAGKGDTP
jgi:Phage derived protein Gp49-like (DUF891)